MSNKKGRITVSFGHNSDNVTGSYTLIECEATKKKILIDFGYIQENVSLLKEYQLNVKKPKFKPKDIDYVFLTHAHIDHSGRLAMLYKWGCNAPLITPQGSRELLNAMLLDGAHINSRNVEDLNKKLGKNYSPLYDENDVHYCSSFVEEQEVGRKIRLDENIEFQLNYNSHIFKSVSITFWIKDVNKTRKIVITGDWGNLTNPQKFTEPFVPFENCNLLIGEATYADTKRHTNPKDRERDYEKIKSAVQNVCYENRGRILIPVFAFGRTPTMLATLYDLFHDDPNFNIPIVYASPLGTKLLEIMLKELEGKDQEYLKEVLAWDKIKMMPSFATFEKSFEGTDPKIFCCPSGMMNAGYSVFAAQKIIPHARDMVMFCGYNAEGSLSRKIKEKRTKTVSIDNKNFKLRCQICNLKSFSSHAQFQDLLDVYSGKNGACYDKIALVHSNQKEKIEFAKVLQEQCERNGKNTKVTAVNSTTEFVL